MKFHNKTYIKLKSINRVTGFPLYLTKMNFYRAVGPHLHLSLHEEAPDACMITFLDQSLLYVQLFL